MQITPKIGLVLLLIFSLAILPLRAAFAASDMNMDKNNTSSGAHCSEMMSSPAEADAAVMDHSKMDHSSHGMKMTAIDSDTSTDTFNAKCCEQCDGDCSHCISAVSAIETQTLNLTAQFINSRFVTASITAHTRILTPPSRPPLLHTL